MSDRIDFRAVFDALPTPYVVLSPDLVIVDANREYLGNTGRTLDSIRGEPLFAVFPAPADSLDDEGRSPVERSLQRVRDTGRAEAMPIQRYAITDADGAVLERYWLLAAAPVLDGQGRVLQVIQRAEDITDFITDRGADWAPSGRWQGRIEQVEADLFRTARALSDALAAGELATRQARSLAEVALALTATEGVADLERIVVGRGLGVLGADGGAIVSPGPDGRWRVTVNEALGAEVQARYGLVEHDSPLPAVWTARTGERLLLPTRAAGLAFHPVMETVYAETHRDAWAFLPLEVDGEQLGSLAVSWVRERQFLPEEIDLLVGFSAQCAQALHRIRAVEAQRDVTRHAQELAGALQQALLTPPPEPDHLHVVVRYLPATEELQVGGDWYDAFLQPDGATMLVVGDVVGHDITAAARMGQLRGLIRALAYAAETDSNIPDTPAAILTRAEHAARGLAVQTLATAILARIERLPDSADTGPRTLRWSNAGHLPPVVLFADGSTTVLDTEPNLLLGIDPAARRADHTTPLPDGSTLLLYTDGLIERRDASLDDGLMTLRAALTDLADRPVDELCDTVLARFADRIGDDDIALIAVRAYPADRPRPPEAGPNRLPDV